MPYKEHCVVHPFEMLSLFSGYIRMGSDMHLHLSKRVLCQFGYTQTILRHLFVFTTVQLSIQDVDERCLNFVYHLIRPDETISGLLGCATGYMEWYFRISHPFVLSVNKDCIRIAPPPVIPNIGDVPETSTQHNSVYVSDYVINVYSTF